VVGAKAQFWAQRMILHYKVLSITCDNVSSNNKMIEELAIQLNDFLGSASQVWCFTHILNLVVKSIMCQFDISDKKMGDIADEATQKLHRLAGNIEHEELLSQSVMFRAGCKVA